MRISDLLDDLREGRAIVNYVPMRLSIPYHSLPWWFGSGWLGLERKSMADYDETEPAQYDVTRGISGGLGKEYTGGAIGKRRESLRDRLLQKKIHLEEQTVLIDRTLALLDSNPQMEEILNLLPKVGLY